MLKKRKITQFLISIILEHYFVLKFCCDQVGVEGLQSIQGISEEEFVLKLRGIFPPRLYLLAAGRYQTIALPPSVVQSQPQRTFSALYR